MSASLLAGSSLHITSWPADRNVDAEENTMADHLFPRTATVRSLAAPSAKCSHAQLLTTLRAGLLALGSVVAVAAFSARASAATVTTDQPDYHPGQTVTITGSGWEPGETVDMVLQEDPPLDPDLALTSVADSNGDFTNTDFTVDVFDLGVTFTLTAAGRSSGQTAETTFTDAPGTCGNGTVESGEDCDLGSALNGAAGSCCKNNCTFASSTNTCRAAAGECDLPETCTGSSATCPADGPRKASGTACTDDGNACTLDQCNGTSTSCPGDAKKANGTACTADTNPCTLDQCNGISNTCQHPAGNAGAVCRAAAGECDVAESCTGSSTTCPSDVFKSNGTACTDDGNPCTADVCSGTSTTCTHPAGNAGAACPDRGSGPRTVLLHRLALLTHSRRDQRVLQRRHHEPHQCVRWSRRQLDPFDHHDGRQHDAGRVLRSLRQQGGRGSIGHDRAVQCRKLELGWHHHRRLLGKR